MRYGVVNSYINVLFKETILSMKYGYGMSSVKKERNYGKELVDKNEVVLNFKI